MPRIARFLKEDEPTVYHVKKKKGDRRIMLDFQSSKFNVLCSMFQKCEPKTLNLEH